MNEMVVISLGFGVVSGVCWGASNPLLTIASRRLGTLPTTLLIHLVGFLSLAGLALWNPGGSLIAKTTLLPTDLLTAALSGCLLGGISALASVCCVRSFKSGHLALVSPVLATDGMLATLLALTFLGEHISLLEGVLLFSCGCGLLLSSLRQHTAEPQASLWLRLLSRGVLLAFLAALLFALMEYGIGAISKEHTTIWMISLVALRLSSCLCLLVATVLFPQTPPGGHEREAEQAPARKEKRVWLGYGAASAAGLLDSASQIAFALGTAHLAAITMSVSAAMSTLLPVLVGLLWWQERLTRRQWIGVILLVSGIPAFAFPSWMLLLILLLHQYVLIAVGWTWLRDWLRRKKQHRVRYWASGQIANRSKQNREGAVVKRVSYP